MNFPIAAMIFEHPHTRDVNKARGIGLRPRDLSPLLMFPLGRRRPRGRRTLQFILRLIIHHI